MHDDTPVYDHPVLSAHARRALVVLAAVAALVLGMFSPAHAADGQLSGTVTGAGTGPLAGVAVEVYEVLPGNHYDFTDYQFTGASGHYGFSLPPGTYVIDFWPSDGSHREEMYDDVPGFDPEGATRVVVTAGSTVVADAELARTASIAGHVDGSTAQDRPYVYAYDAAHHLVGVGFLDRQGDYEVGGLEAGSYRLAFNRLSGFAFSAAEYYDDHAEGEGFAAADQVTLADGEARTGVDAALTEGGHITGTLQDSDGHAIHCRLQAFTTDNLLVTRSGWSDATTGAFDIAGLSTGSYRVRVVNGQACQNGQQYVDGDGGALSADPTAAADVAATLGGTTPLGPALVYDLGPVPTNTVAPSVTGSPTIGSRLTAHHGTWSPSTHLSYHYQWLANGVPVGGATRTTYSVTAADTGKALAVRVTVTRGSRTATATSAATAPVAAPPLANMAPPQVTARPEVAVNALLIAQPGLWVPLDASFTYVWSSGARVWQSGPDTLFRVPDGAYAQSLTLTVVAHRSGYADTSVSVPVASSVARGDWFSGLHRTPVLRGMPRLGRTLHVKAWAKPTPQPTEKTYVWYRDGKRIRGAKHKEYTLVRADVGHRIRVAVVYHRPSYRNHAVFSHEVGPVEG
jgi:hypothetical protein